MLVVVSSEKKDDSQGSAAILYGTWRLCDKLAPFS